MSIKDFFKKTHPFIFNRSSLIIPFLVTALILLIFQPFEFAHFSSARTLALAIVFGGTAAACVFITTTTLRYLSPDYFDEEEGNARYWKGHSQNYCSLYLRVPLPLFPTQQLLVPGPIVQ